MSVSVLLLRRCRSCCGCRCVDAEPNVCPFSQTSSGRRCTTGGLEDLIETYTCSARYRIAYIRWYLEAACLAPSTASQIDYCMVLSRNARLNTPPYLQECRHSFFFIWHHLQRLCRARVVRAENILDGIYIPPMSPRINIKPCIYGPTAAFVFFPLDRPPSGIGTGPQLGTISRISSGLRPGIHQVGPGPGNVCPGSRTVSSTR